MSDREPDVSPELAAVAELERLVQRLGVHLAGFRQRALQAEARLRLYEAGAPEMSPATRQRIAELERENSDLRARLEAATERTRVMIERVRFLRQQSGGSAPGGGSDRP